MIYRWLPVLDDVVLAGLEFLDAATAFRISSFANAMYELATDKTAPHKAAGVTQAVKGHNHTRVADSGYGGMPVARNTVWAGGLGRSGLWKVTVSGEELNTWIAADRDAPTSRTANGIAQVIAPVSPGMTSPGTSPPSGNPYLDAMLFVYWASGSGPHTVDFRWSNATRGHTSLVKTQASDGFAGWLRTTEIPVNGGVDNSLELQVRSTHALDIYVNYVHLSESIIVDEELVAVAALTGGSAAL